MSAQVVSLDHQMEFQIFFHTVKFVLYVSQIAQAYPHHFLRDLAVPEEQRCLLWTCELPFRQFRWFLIGMELTCRDTNISLHKREWTPANYLYQSYLVSDLAARTLQTLHRFLRSFVVRWVALSPTRVRVLHHDCVTMLQTRFVLHIENLVIRRHHQIFLDDGLGLLSLPGNSCTKLK